MGNPRSAVITLTLDFQDVVFQYNYTLTLRILKVIMQIMHNKEYLGYMDNRSFTLYNYRQKEIIYGY